MHGDLLVYGSYGYTGQLIVEHALEEGHTPTLAGRDAEKVEAQATDHDLDHRVFSLEHLDVIERAVDGFDAVLNCAGPFSKTAKPLYSACLDAGTDYLDITGEIDVLEAIAGRQNEAKAQEVTLLPAVGFDVVPTDCLAAHLAEKVESPTDLTLAIDGLSTYSPGTLKSIIEGLGRPGAVRERGKIRTVPSAYETRQLDFGEGPKTTVTIPWGDVSTAYRTTGIGNVQTYASVPDFAAKVMRKTRPLTPIWGLGPVQSILKSVVDKVVSGPSEKERAKHTIRVWGEVVDESGERKVARLRTPDAYELTAETAVEASRRVIAGEVEPGFQTPGSAFGADFVTEFEGVEREDVATGPTAATESTEPWL